MIRRLLWLFLLVLGWLLLRRTVARPAPPRRRAGEAPRDEGSMVRDRVCETFVPRSRAILVLHGGQEHFFCSEGCRTRFLAGAGPAR